MKILLFSGLLLISTYISNKSDCDSIQLELNITHTTDGRNNGNIDVIVKKGEAPFKVYLFAEKRVDNLLEVKFKDLKNLGAGDYVLVVQDSRGDCTFRQNVKLN